MVIIFIIFVDHMKSVLAFVALVALAVSTPIEMKEKVFQSYMMQHNKMYDTWEEYNFRMEVMMANFQKVRAEHPEFKPHQMGPYFDMEEEEFSASRNGFKPELRTTERNVKYLKPSNAQKVDWRSSGAITPVKNQGSCGSCWAFSTTGSLEAAYYFKNKNLKSFSEQQLVDCSTSFGNQGCNGGLMDDAFKYLKTSKSEQESSYPYTGADGTCSYNEGQGVTNVASYTDVAQDCSQLKAAVSRGPVSVAVEANFWWQMYFGGISKACSPGTKESSLNHGVLAVGYDDTASTPYWIIKNSWGGSWGESGYIRLAQSNDCGICLSASYPEV